MSEMRLEFLDDTLQGIGPSLVSFYHSVIACDGFEEAEEVKRVLKHLRKRYVKKLRENDFSSISFESSASRNAYVFQYCSSFTGAVASSFALFLKSNPGYVSELCSKDAINFCCLGGGPATELVAFYFLLKDVLLNNPLTNGSPLVLNACIVDVDRGWAQTAARVVGRLQALADASYAKVKVKFTFIHHDVTSPMTERVKEVLKASDVVTMVKFLSAIHGPTSADVRSAIVRDVCDHLPPHCSLFFMDSSGWKYVDEVAVAIDSCEKMTRVYGIEKNKYKLSRASKSLCFRLYDRRFGPKYCTVVSLNKIGVWRKMTLENSNDVDIAVKLNEVLRVV